MAKKILKYQGTARMAGYEWNPYLGASRKSTFRKYYRGWIPEGLRTDFQKAMKKQAKIIRKRERKN